MTLLVIETLICEMGNELRVCPYQDEQASKCALGEFAVT
jgi:hypothetical protein